MQAAGAAAAEESRQQAQPGVFGMIGGRRRQRKEEARDLAVPVPDDDPGLRDDEDPLGDLFSPLDDGEGGSQG